MRHLDYRDVAESGFDAVSSIGLIEHIGVKNYAAYFRFLRAKLRPGGRLLNHGITRADNMHPGLQRRGFIGRYVFPDGELTGSGDIVRGDRGRRPRGAAPGEPARALRQDAAPAGARTWSTHWDEAVADAGLPVGEGLGPLHGRVAARLRAQQHPAAPDPGHQDTPDGDSGYPLRHDFGV